MFGNQNEHSSFPQNIPIVAVIDQEQEKTKELIEKIQNGVSQIKSRPLKMMQYTSINELPKKDTKVIKPQKDAGIINLKWINTITTIRPSLILYIYYVNSSIDPLEEEKKMYQEIEMIRSNDKYVPIILRIISNVSYNFDSDDREKKYCLSRLIGKDNVKTYTSTTIMLKMLQYAQFSSSIVRQSREYYRTLKKNIKVLMNKVVNKEQIAKYEIKLGILSLMKSKNQLCSYSKHFVEAYKILVSKEINVEKYFYGDENVKLNFCQLKAAADWVFFKLIKISENNQTNKNKINENIQKFKNQLETFGNLQYYDKEKNGKADNFLLFEFYWRYLRLDAFSKYLNSIPSSMNNISEFEGTFLLQEMYNVSRIIKILEQYEDLNLNSVILDDKKELSLDLIKNADVKYFEKAPVYCYHINPLDVKIIGFNEDIYLRKFIIENNITAQNLRKIVRENLIPSILRCFDKLLAGGFKGINLYLLIINLLNEDKSSENDLMFIDLKNIFYNLTPKLVKFPKVYFHFVTKYTDALIKRLESSPNSECALTINDKNTILQNLITTGNYRNLTEKEEEIFFKLLKQEDSNMTPGKEKAIEHFSVNTMNNDVFNNKIFGFDYEISGGNNGNKKVLELVEYDFKFTTILTKEPLKFSSVTFFFGIENRNKKFTVFPNDLTKDTPVNLQYKIIIQNKEKYLILRSVQFTLQNSPNVIYEIKINTVNEKVILFNHPPQNVLEFKTPSMIKVGVNEYYNLECEIVKDQAFDVNVGQLIITFQSNLMKRNILSTSSQNSVSQSITPSPSKVPTTSMKNTLDLLATKKAVPFSTSMSTFLNDPSASVIQSGPSLAIQTPPIFYKKENGKIEEKDSVTFTISDFDEHCKTKTNKISFLIKFPEKGNYIISYNASYQILKKDIESDSVELSDSKRINFEVEKPFDYKDEKSSVQYMSFQNQKYFANNSLIKLNLLLITNLNTKAIIKKIIINNKEQGNVQVSCPLIKIIESINLPMKEALLTILPRSEYIIPFDCIFSRENAISFGDVTIEWTTEGLMQFSEEIVNSNTFPFPPIYTKPFDISLNYILGDYNKETNSMDFIVKVQNLKSEFKKTTFILNNNTQFFIDGFVRQKLKFLPNEIKDIVVKLSPLSFGNMKLPPFKEMEFSFEKEDQKIYSIYYYPDYIQFQP